MVETGEHSQSTDAEDAAQADFAAGGELQPPDLRHGQQQDGEVDDDVGDVGPDEPFAQIDAVPVGRVAVPERGDGTALEDGGQEGRGAPGEDEGEEGVDDPGEGLVDAEDAQVQAQDGGLDQDDDQGVEDLVCEGVDLEFYQVVRIRNCLFMSAGAVV